MSQPMGTSRDKKESHVFTQVGKGIMAGKPLTAV